MLFLYTYRFRTWRIRIFRVWSLSFSIRHYCIVAILSISLGWSIQKSVYSGSSAHELTFYDEFLQEKNHFLLTKKFHKISMLAKIFDILSELIYPFLDRFETSSTTFLESSLVALHFLLWVSGVFFWKNLSKKSLFDVCYEIFYDKNRKIDFLVT